MWTDHEKPKEREKECCYWEKLIKVARHKWAKTGGGGAQWGNWEKIAEETLAKKGDWIVRAIYSSSCSSIHCHDVAVICILLLQTIVIVGIFVTLTLLSMSLSSSLLTSLPWSSALFGQANFSTQNVNAKDNWTNTERLMIEGGMKKTNLVYFLLYLLLTNNLHKHRYKWY